MCVHRMAGDVRTLLLGAGSFVAVMVAYVHRMAGDVRTLLLGAGSFVALMVAGLIACPLGRLKNVCGRQWLTGNSSAVCKVNEMLTF